MKRVYTQFHSKYGPWALVAGGSLGLGAEYARQLAARGFDLVVVAESDQPLLGFCEGLADEHRVRIQPVVADLGDSELIARLRSETLGREIGLLVYNAAHSYVGDFLDQPLDSLLEIVAVNCRGPLVLAREYGLQMAERRRGGMILMGSLAGLQGTPLVAAYAASKAFNVVLGESLWEELGHRGVDVLSFCPGATRTPGWTRTRPQPSGGIAPPVMEVQEVVTYALAALGRGPAAIPGRRNRLAAAFLRRLLSRRSAVRVMARSMRAQYRNRTRQQGGTT